MRRSTLAGPEIGARKRKGMTETTNKTRGGRTGQRDGNKVGRDSHCDGIQA